MSLTQYATLTERKIAKRIVDAFLAAGWAVSVNDGEEITVSRSTDRATILGAMATTEADTLSAYRHGKRAGWVWLVYGNGDDLISDYCASGPVSELLDQILNEIA